MANNPLGVCYLPTNSSDLLDLGMYQLQNGNPLFDIAIIFAANINYDTDTKQAYLYFNETVTNVLDNAATRIRPLQEKGIKILLCVLGNHQGAGICNFPTQEAATAFAQQLTDAVEKYGLDGVDFDDEYAEYGSNGTGPVNDFSFPYLIQALRQQMPDKILSLYYYGPAVKHLSYDGIEVGSLINYSWNAIYGTFNPPYVPGLGNAALAPAAVCIDPSANAYTQPEWAAQLATQTIQEGYGAYLYYALTNNDSSAYLTQVSQALYGENTIYTR
jgi:hypothetical protein